MSDVAFSWYHPPNRTLSPAHISLQKLRIWKGVPSFYMDLYSNWTSCRTILNNYWMRFFVISRIIKVEVSLISRSRRRRLITLTETLIILDITKTESNNCFIIHWTKNTGSHVFASSLTANNTKRELHMISLRNHAPRSYMTWLPVTLSVLDMTIV